MPEFTYFFFFIFFFGFTTCQENKQNKTQLPGKKELFLSSRGAGCGPGAEEKEEVKGD